MRHKQDILKDSYINPYYPRKEIRVNKSFVLTIIFFIVTGYLLYFIFFSTHFKIKTVLISGLEYISKNDVMDIVERQFAKKRFMIFPRNNFFFLNEKELEDAIANNFLLEKISVYSEKINNVRIDIMEKPSIATWISGEKYYYLDIHGRVRKEVTPEEVDRNYLIIYNAEEKSKIPAIKDQVLNEQRIHDALIIKKEISEKTGFKIISFNYKKHDGIEEFSAKTDKGYYIYFDLASDLLGQLNSFYILNGEFKKGKEPREYVDLRFGERVYYK